MNSVWIRSVERRIANFISRGSLTKPLDDQASVQNAELSPLPGETLSGILRSQQYGFTSRPSEGAEIVMICGDGLRENAIVISADHPLLRPRIEDYEACLWTKFGSHVWLKADGSASIKGAKYTVEASESVFTSDKFGVKNSANIELIKSIYDAINGIQTAIGSGATAGGDPFVPVPAGVSALTQALSKINQFLV